MIEKTGFFRPVDHFVKTAHIPCIQILESSFPCIPKVTIAIPTYKRAELLKEAIESALNQIDYDNYDVMVLDNNPERNDETEKLLLTYKNARLSYYKNVENVGMAGNWNRLYEIARGEWVVMLHDDDLLKENYLSILFKRIIDIYKDKYAVYIPSFECVNLLKNNSSIGCKDKAKLSVEKIHYKDFCHGNIIGPPLGLCIQKSMMRNLGGFDDNYYPVIDYQFYIRASYHAEMARIIGLPLCTYRIQENESLKIETVKGLAGKMIEILTILNSRKLKPGKYLWNKYSQMIGYYLLQACKYEYKLEEKEINTLMVSLNIKIDVFSCIVHRLFSLSYKLRKRVHNFTLQNSK